MITMFPPIPGIEKHKLLLWYLVCFVNGKEADATYAWNLEEIENAKQAFYGIYGHGVVITISKIGKRSANGRGAESDFGWRKLKYADIQENAVKKEKNGKTKARSVA